MELVDEQRFPEPVKNLKRVVLQRQAAVEVLDLAEAVFQLSVVALGPGLGGQGGAVFFEVEFADPEGQFVGDVVEGVEERLGVAEPHLRHAFHVGQAPAVLQVVFTGPTAAVADAEQVEVPVEERFFLQVPLAVVKQLRCQVGVIGVLGWEVRDDF